MSFPDFLIPEAIFVADNFRKKNGEPYGKRAQYKIRHRLRAEGAIVTIAGRAFVNTRTFEKLPPAKPERSPLARRHVRRQADAAE